MIPNRPIGSTNFHKWAQSVHDRTFSGQKPGEAAGTNVSRTTRGSFVLPNQQRGQVLPFRIYRGSTWLKAKVTTGPIVTTGDWFEPDNPDTDLTLTSASDNWIYFEFADATSGEFIVETTPSSDSTRIPIGIVNTDDTVNQSQVITQLWPFFIYHPCL